MSGKERAKLTRERDILASRVARGIATKAEQKRLQKVVSFLRPAF